ncbi:glycosyltransferase family 2 protein [Deinococcus yavapaiensis]|uniref:Rhamnosyltransferase n=1 Tax=Deinococcus yavapaiensis KR-236 TaxID=694435 RepID=A0A318SEE3_9DEIO|nr:rhamnosyltransferase [Deinococcus yavapaiensis KR-236]
MCELKEPKLVKVGIIVPTLNPGIQAEALISAVSKQTLQPLLRVAIDSASTDDSVRLWREAGWDVLEIERGRFDHGGTRNFAAHYASEADVLVFLTQDAQPISRDWLKRLVAPLASGEVAATFGRQLPRPQASLFERYARFFNYPPVSHRMTRADIPTRGVKAFFFSNVCSAVRRDAFFKVGGFPERTIMNEDMLLAGRFLKHGYAIGYVADAPVMHSHEYTLAQQFRRNFDVGVFFADFAEELEGASVGREGVRFVLGQTKYALRHGRPDLLPVVVVEAAVKYTAFQIGKRHAFLPRRVKQVLSMHKYHWEKQG